MLVVIATQGCALVVGHSNLLVHGTFSLSDDGWCQGACIREWLIGGVRVKDVRVGGGRPRYAARRRLKSWVGLNY